MNYSNHLIFLRGVFSSSSSLSQRMQYNVLIRFQSQKKIIEELEGHFLLCDLNMACVLVKERHGFILGKQNIVACKIK